MNVNKNNTLEMLKLFASYMVVFIHIMFYGKTGMVIDALARFAVPFFFLVSGFYSYQITCEKIKKRIRNILTLLVLSVVCYASFTVLTLMLEGNMGGVVSYLSSYLNVFTLAKLVVFNMPITAQHLWYLFAILYVYVIFYFVTKLRISYNLIFIVSFFLLFLHILLGESFSVLGIRLPVPVVRNFVLMGIPFFTLGLFVKKYEHKIHSIPNQVVFGSIIFGVVESILSYCFFGKNELFIGSLLILFAIVCVFLKYPNVQYPPWLMALDGCSTYIYIFHIMISVTMTKIYMLFGIETTNSVIAKNIHPILVCIVSTAFAYMIIRILKLVKNKLNPMK